MNFKSVVLSYFLSVINQINLQLNHAHDWTFRKTHAEQRISLDSDLTIAVLYLAEACH